MNKRSTRKNHTHSSLPVTLLQFLFVLKLFHWNTESYAKHISSDQLYTSLSTHIDEFVEVLIRNDKRPTSFKIPAFSFSMQAFEQTLHDFRRVMARIQQPDLLNLRDDIINDIDQFTYRLRLH
jgi:DNA-binding ferritin-like protein